MKSKIRPIYSELQGYLSQAPVIKDSNTAMYDSVFWEQVNLAIEELKKVINEGDKDSLDRFRITPLNDHHFGNYIHIAVYRQKLGGLISSLHGKYFFDEVAPFSGMPSTVINQNQSQQQHVQVSVLLEVQAKILERLNSTQDQEEKDFLEAIKSQLGQVKNILDLLNLIIVTANTMGVSIDKLKNIFV